jgi:hypothetical protein
MKLAHHGASLYLYGPDADRLYERVENILENHPYAGPLKSPSAEDRQVNRNDKSDPANARKV